MRSLHTYCFALCLVSLSGHLPAQQNPQPHFRNYSTEQGLPSPEVYCAFQDSRGYMWFGTDNGAARFDGYEFRSYSAQDGLTSNVVFDIFEDAKGRIWFGTMRGEAFILEGDTIVSYPFNHLIQQYRGKYQGVGLDYLEPDETAWFMLEHLGFLRIDSTGRDSLITTERPLARLVVEVEQSPKVMTNFIARRYEEQFWYWTDYNYKQQLSQLTVISEKGSWQKELFYQEPCNIAFKAQKLCGGELLVFNCSHLFCLQNGDLLWSISFDIDMNEIIEDQYQAIWLCGKYGKGLRRYRNLEALKNGKYDLFFDGLSISNFYTDSQNGIWVTTIERGVFYCSDFQLLTYDTRFGLSDNFVSAVAFKNEFELYAGCENGDIFQINLAQNRIENSMVNSWGFHNFDLLYQAEANALWSNGAFWKDEKWNFISYHYPGVSQIQKINLSKLDKLHINCSGELLGCNSAGLYIVDTKKHALKFSSIFFPKMRERTFALHTDQKERLWVGNARGLFEFRDSMLVSPRIDHPAFHHRVEDIDEFPDSSLVFGTKGWGVVRWKEEDIRQISTDEGLTSNMIEDVHVDEKGILWVGTLNGLNKITFDGTNQPTIRKFTVANGLPSNEIYKIKSYAGQLWLCTSGGLVKFHEQQQDSVSVSPILQDLVVNGDIVKAGQKSGFSYQENNFTFQFLTINYRQNGTIPYRFRLNEQADWSYTQNLSVNYPQLPPDDYRFEVQAQNEDGYWSDSTLYPFRILPPWWQRGSTQVGFVSLGLLAFFGVYKRRTTQLRKEAAVQQQITELERAALQAQMNPHFIFNCLNSIQNFIIQNDKKKAVEFLARFARLVRINLNISVLGSVRLADEVLMLENYLTLERERFNETIDFSITKDDALDDNIQFPPLLIQPYVENAVIHGLSKKAGGGRIDIHFSKDNGQMAVSIRDNGLGYRVGQQKEATARHKSIGMSLTQQRLRLLQKEEQDVVQIETLQAENGEMLGTEVRLRLRIE